ncbi:putative transcription factor WD40-like family [Lupinus albus]|uniref:Putative transcription factor WD40-like family n=1 Tax=Lupinus albus TaxID=3870 RepID=A0A6A4PDY7_LUPAL|nr:putative transcription factor WD40-like family [Lupinus albus]
MAFPGNSNQQQQHLQTQTQTPHFDLNKLFNPTTNNPLPSNPTNLNTSPSFPSPSPSPPSSFPTPSSSYPPPTSTYPFQNPHYFPYPNIQQQHLHQMNVTQRPVFQPLSPSPSSPNPNTTSSARLMAMLNTQNPSSNPDSPVLHQAAPSSNEFSVPTSPAVVPLPLPASPQSSTTPARIMSTKFPRGRRLIGESIVYDIDFKLPSEVQPQLEVTPITKYASDPGLMLGRQIAVNRTYICYGLKLGAIRVLNINTALRYLLRGHTQKVTDMAFFAEDLHLLASASTDGRIFVWKINEDPGDEDKPQIAGKVITAIQILGESESVHPRVCWHPHKQEILMVAIGNRILKVDTMKAGKGEKFSAEEPLKCSIDKLIDGVHLVGKHDGNVTELSMCQWMKSRLASASEDGTVKIWEERNARPLAVIRPHDGKPVNFVTFLTAPHRPDHIVLITAQGPLNQEVKIWVSDNEEGWLLPSDSESWSCIQTLDIRSSSEANPEDAFFNQIVALPHAGLFLLANAKKNTIYSVHIEYGSNPTATRMDYISEFTVTMPILSLTGTSDSLPDGENIVQIYCVQTQAIQQYALNLSQCLPPPLDNADLEKPELNLSCSSNALNESSNLETRNMPEVHSNNSESAPVVSLPVNLSSSDISGLPEASTSDIETKTNDLPSHNGFEHIQSSLPPHPPSPRLSLKLSGLKGSSNNLESTSANADHNSEQTNLESSAERIVESEKDNTTDVPGPGDSLKKNDGLVQNDVSMVSNSPATFKHPTHLVTPSEIFSKASLSSENPQISQGMNAQDVAAHSDAENSEVEVKVEGETGSNQENNEYDRDMDSNTDVAEKKDKLFYSQASDLGIQMAREAYNTEGVRHADNIKTINVPDKSPNVIEEEVQDTSKDAPVSNSESENVAVNFQSPIPALKGKRQKGKSLQVSGRSSISPFDSTDSSNNQGGNSGGSSKEAAFPQLSTMHEMLSQLLSMQKEMQKQMTAMVSVPVTKESKRLEGSLGRSMEKVVKANSDALWARVQEENAKQEKLEQECTQQITNLISNYVNKDMTTVLEKIIKKEISSIGSTVASSVSQIIEKTVSSAIVESFQKGVGEKGLNQVDKSVSSKLEATMARQIQTQFQTSGKQALQHHLTWGIVELREG